jgi:hypothetical protein
VRDEVWKQCEIEVIASIIRHASGFGDERRNPAFEELLEQEDRRYGEPM